jgi:hypothetical protein
LASERAACSISSSTPRIAVLMPIIVTSFFIAASDQPTSASMRIVRPCLSRCWKGIQ